MQLLEAWLKRFDTLEMTIKPAFEGTVREPVVLSQEEVFEPFVGTVASAIEFDRKQMQDRRTMRDLQLD